MIEAQADAEDDQDAQYLCARVEAVYPCAFIEIQEDVHLCLLPPTLNLQHSVSASTLAFQLFHHLLNLERFRA